MKTDNSASGAIGQPINRVEGQAKVTGEARYAADHHFLNMAYGVFTTSRIAKGRITGINSKTAEQLPGVLTVISHLNTPDVPGYHQKAPSPIPIFYGQPFRLFYDDRVHHNLQPVALVVAETLELARYASTLVNITYEQLPFNTNIHAALHTAFTPANSANYCRGDAGEWEQSAVKLEMQYETPQQVHNPMEPHAATAYWEQEDRLVIHNKSQGVKTTQQQYAQFFNLKPENIKVYSEYVGGAFGSSSRVWPHEMAAVLGAKKIGRPVKVALAREQVFNMVGYRPWSVQQYKLGATADGKLTGIAHDAWGTTSQYEQFIERILDPTKSMYQCDNVSTTYQLVALDTSTPCPARGPGETSGAFAMESAMDELAYALQVDPLELRLNNYPALDQRTGLPWSSIHLKECYRIGAERFGWAQRNPQPRSTQNGQLLTGLGMSAGIYKAERAPAAAQITITAEGKVLIKTSVADTGPGSATILTQIAAEALGLEAHSVSIAWGDAAYPTAPPQFGSHTTASTGSAVHEAAMALKKKFMSLRMPTGTISLKNYTHLLQQQGIPELEATSSSKPGPETEKHSGKSFCANFVEVQVHALTGEVRVKRVVSVVDAGRLMNAKTARSQVLGSVVWGIGVALMEAGIVDHRSGRHVNHNLAEYHLPVNADVPEIDVHFINEADPYLDPMGAKGLGEIALIGFSAAVANAVYHATGKRVRDLPITPDKLL